MEFTQFMLPYGESKKVEITRSPEIESLASFLTGLGYVFEIEILRTGEINMECIRHEEEGVEDSFPQILSIIICANDIRVPFIVDQLVRKAKSHYDLLNKIENKQIIPQ